MRRSRFRVAVITTVSTALVALSLPMAQAGDVAPPGDPWAWGRNDAGYVGNGCVGHDIDRPERVTRLLGVTLISHGALAVTSDMQLWAWGPNSHGQVGDGTTEMRCEPVMVPGMDDVVAISGGHQYSLALRANGRVWAWGDNDYGQLGNETTVDSPNPMRVRHLKNAVAVSAGPDHALALKANGKVKAWGNNTNGELGDGTTLSQLRPRTVPGLTDVVSISAGGYDDGIRPDYGFNLVVRADGTLWAWGYNKVSQLGDGTTITRYVPTEIPGLTDVAAVSAGDYFSLALRIDGTAWAWGENSNGELGNGTTMGSRTPQQVPGLAGVTAVAAGGQYSLALTADGLMFAWGENSHGQLGNGEPAGDVLEPGQVLDLTGVTAIDAGLQTSYAIAMPSSG